MLLRDLITRLDKSDKYKHHIEIEDLEEILHDQFYITMHLDTNKENTRVTCYWFLHYYDDYSWCGFKALFLDDELVAIVHKKDEDDDIKFVSFAMKQRLKEYILSLAEVEEELTHPNAYVNLDEEMGQGYKLNYAGQLETTHVIYNSQKCEVIYPTFTSNGKEYRRLYPNNNLYSYNYEDAKPKELINIKLPDDSVISVELKDVDVCYNII